MPSPTLTVLMDGGGSDPEDVVRFDVGYVALPGYFIADTPWAGYKATSGAGPVNLRAQDSTNLGGGYAYGPNASDNTISWDFQYQAGTYKIAMLTGKGPTYAILTHKYAGVSVGTVDMYTAAAQTFNNYSEITTIAVTAGLKTHEVSTPTKNASSTAFSLALQSIAHVRTAA